MNTALWVDQVFLSLVFLYFGISKIFQPREVHVKKFPRMTDLSARNIKFIGVIELIGAIGLTAPMFVKLPVVTSLAAVDLGLVMICATAYHISRKEYRKTIETILLLCLIAFVAYCRY